MASLSCFQKRDPDRREQTTRDGEESPRFDASDEGTARYDLLHGLLVSVNVAKL